MFCYVMLLESSTEACTVDDTVLLGRIESGKRAPVSAFHARKGRGDVAEGIVVVT